MNRPDIQLKSDYRVSFPLATRWSDNDNYGHVNNVVYYAWFDTAVNAHLIEQGLLDLDRGEIIGLVVESGCTYHRAISFPGTVDVMLRVAHVGRSSVRYEIGLFTDGYADAAATGHFIHVYVDRASRRPVALPQQWRDVLANLRV